jgi:hypothetical protein
MQTRWSSFKLPLASNAVPFAGAPNVLVTPTDILLDGHRVGRSYTITASGRLQELGDLSRILKVWRDEFKHVHPDMPPPAEINLWVDSRVNALVVKSVIQAAAVAGFAQGYFVVRQRAAAPSLGRLSIGGKVPGQASSAGLPKPVIQAVVRSQFAIFRACYEQGLGRNSALAGLVVVQLVIDKDGIVASASDYNSDIADPKIVECVVQGFRTLRFPMPEGGSASVEFPIQFGPG